MSSVKYNIIRKMEWMARRLRYIDGAGEIKEWAAAMSALNVVLKEVDFKDSSDIHICTIYGGPGLSGPGLFFFFYFLCGPGPSGPGLLFFCCLV